jgi:hypothetical protein
VRFTTTNPIITPASGRRVGTNINGPSLIRVPAWATHPLGRYYLYFGHHRGDHIRLAYADELAGPWKVYDPGVLELKDSFFNEHIASPDVIVDDERHEFRLYYHGHDSQAASEPYLQRTRVAIGRDGLRFVPRQDVLADSAYWRVFRRDGWWYGLAMPGTLYRSRDGLTGFEKGPNFFAPERPAQDACLPEVSCVRHTTLDLQGDRLAVYYTRIADAPERILRATVDLRKNWLTWNATDIQELLQPETDWEGAQLPVTRSNRGAAPGPVRALRDPFVFKEAGRKFLLYAVAGESGLAIAELVEDSKVSKEH